MRQSLVVGLIALVLAGSARRSEAGIGDFIWELSGPQMIGAGISCRFNFKGVLQYCEFSAGTGLAMDIRNFEKRQRWFWSVGLAGYVSTGKNNRYDDNLSCPSGEFPCQGKEIDYHDFDHRMFSLEPTIDYLVGKLHVGTRRDGMPREASVFVGAGGALHHVWNRDAGQFWKSGYKIVPVEIRTRKIAVAFNLRYYPDGFGVDQFGKGEPIDGNRPSEWTKGVSVSFPFK